MAYIQIGMKKLVSKSRDGLGFLVLAIALLCMALVISGCIYTEKEVVGKYSRTGAMMNEILILRRDHSFEQELIYTNGVHYYQTSSWSKVNGVIRFNNFYWSFDAELREIAPPKISASCDLEIGSGFLAISYDRRILFEKTGEN